MKHRWPITAFSACNGMGDTVHSIRQKFLAGEHGLQRYEDEQIHTWCGRLPEVLPVLPNALSDFDSRQTRICALIYSDLHCDVEKAIQRWGAERVGLVFGTSTGGIAATEQYFFDDSRSAEWPSSNNMLRRHAISAALEVVRSMSGIRGPVLAISTACSSSAKVFATGKRLLETGHVDAVILGGVDTLCRLTLQGFSSLEVLSSNRCRPFGANRDGINLGEGGSFVLVEREGDADCELIAVGESSDGYHMTSPHPEGLGARLAMCRAMQQGEIEIGQIDCVNAHATGTMQNDKAECIGIADAVGRNVPVVATKGYTGHLLGAAGVTEVVFTLMMIKDEILPLLPGSLPLDDTLQVQISHQARAYRSDYVLSNSLAFGGTNVSVLVGRQK